MRFASSLLIALAISACGGGDDFDSFAEKYVKAACHRDFTCCRPEDRGPGLATADEATCVAMQLPRLRENATQELRFGLVRFDAEAGRQCLARLETATCPELFEKTYGNLVGCPDFLPGTTPLGQACDDDYVCASNWCVSQTCTPLPCAQSCAAGQYCDGVTGCVPVVAPGAACTVHDQCGPDGACIGKLCVPRAPDGAACRNGRECAGTCDAPPSTMPMGTCRPGQCQGL